MSTDGTDEHTDDCGAESGHPGSAGLEQLPAAVLGGEHHGASADPDGAHPPDVEHDEHDEHKGTYRPVAHIDLDYSWNPSYLVHNLDGWRTL